MLEKINYHNHLYSKDITFGNIAASLDTKILSHLTHLLAIVDLDVVGVVELLGPQSYGVRLHIHRLNIETK